jgi:hypothetical protein
MAQRHRRVLQLAQNLDNATWFDADQQLALNIDMAGPVSG